MADNEIEQTQGGTAVAEPETTTEAEFQYAVTVADAGPATKKVSVEIPADRIKEKLTEQFKELRQKAILPGFRPGRVPAKLVERKFGVEIKEQVRRDLIRESYEQAVAANKLAVLGEPAFDAGSNITLPEAGPLNYTFEVEVQPEFTLPSLTGIPVKRPKVEVKEENVDQAMANLREQQGTLVPIEDGGIVAKDMITADVHVKVDGKVVGHQHDAQLVARPAKIGGIEVPDFADRVAGAKAGETRSISIQGPEGHPNEAVRGKLVELEVTIKDVKRLELAEVTPEFLSDLGFDTEQQVRDALREQMVERISYDVAQAQREQVQKYLLDNTTLDLPTRLSVKQVDRVVQRRAMDLVMRGIPQEQVLSRVELLRAGAADEAARELKLFFIVQKIADDQQTEVSEGELNGRIAMLASQRGERPDKLKSEMAKDGSLENLYIQMREQKALDKVLESAAIEEVEVASTTPAAEPVDTTTT
jgi:trigger factor